MMRIRCLGLDPEPLRLLSAQPDDWAQRAAGPDHARRSVPGWARLAGWWHSRRAAGDQELVREIEALRGRVEMLEGSLLGIVRAVQEGLDLAAGTDRPPESAAVPPPVAEPFDARPISPGEMWALTPEMWGDTVETWAESPVPARPESPPAIRFGTPERASRAREDAEQRPEPWAGAPSEAPPAAPAEPWSDGAAADARSLGHLRPAALRLAEDGWPPETIAEKLRLGLGDIQLILKTDLLRPKTGHAELAHTRR